MKRLIMRLKFSNEDTTERFPSTTSTTPSDNSNQAAMDANASDAGEVVPSQNNTSKSSQSLLDHLLGIPTELRLQIFEDLFILSSNCAPMTVREYGMNFDRPDACLLLWRTFHNLLAEIEPIGAELFEVLFKKKEFNFSIFHTWDITAMGGGAYEVTENRGVRGFGRCWLAEEDISRIDLATMNQFRTVRLELPVRFGISGTSRPTMMEVVLPEDVKWFVDKLNRLQNLRQVIVRLKVKSAADWRMNDEESTSRVHEFHAPLKNLLKVDVIIEMEWHRYDCSK